MPRPRADAEQQRILRYWWLLELLSPQTVPKLTSPTSPPSGKRVIEWTPAVALPWENLPSPTPRHGKPRVWKHTVYLGVYTLEATYEYLHRAFGEDKNAYEQRPGGQSACAALLMDEHGRIETDSPILSSALWAVPRIKPEAIHDSAWADGFPEATRAFVQAVDQHEGARREQLGLDAPPAQDAESLLAVLRLAHEAAGVAGIPGLATQGVVIESVVVLAKRNEDAVDMDFLNSLFLDDLAGVRGEVASGRGWGQALERYLMGDDALDDRDRVDVIRDHATTDSGVAADRLPRGRWPADPCHPLSLRQQFAVNQALSDLSPVTGLMGVNGPPGTGKTTMLRDILAGNVVERARALATLERPGTRSRQHDTHGTRRVGTRGPCLNCALS